ncbi:MAG TPA: sugar phosphate isomerase/epimerase family protein [Bryobacteraceae bacterium]|nr:sugar phosphate isomerase/epimerase family protein [Bryobacteraceae bacterium]
MTRRNLLEVAGAALATSFAPHLVSAAAGGVRFGVRSPLPNTSLRERAMLVKQTGFDGIELGNEWSDKPLEFLQKELDGTGVAVSAIVGSIQLLEVDAQKRAQAIETDRQRLQLAKALKADCVIEVPTFGPNRFPDLSPVMNAREVEERLLVAQLKQLVAAVESSGVTLLLEPCNHKETHFMYQQGQAASIIERVGSPGLGILSDFYHMQIEEPSIPETLGLYGRLTRYVHLADGEKRTEPGSLPFDYRPGFRALKQWGYSGWLTVESKFTDTPEAALSRALKYLKQQWAQA